MLSCSPKCKEDSECQGRKCCPNICNMKSCVPANHKSNSNDGYKGSSQNAESKEEMCKTAKCKNNLAARFLCSSDKAYRKRCA
ncbi:unnamed protein product [Acanthoscelides obtectus]|nr:unnamed protein product [Acanthoscelides obtectus]CAK1683113.1 hypothetical protein AOBTE_LOCUS34088 [Acanthoscelides obtectus]